MTTVNTPTTPATGNSSQTPAEAYQSAFDALRSALATIVQETQPGPLDRPYSGDSYLPEHLIEAAQQALVMTAKLREPNFERGRTGSAGARRWRRTSPG